MIIPFVGPSGICARDNRHYDHPGPHITHLALWERHLDSFILKVALLAITMYLVKQFRDRDAIFFYINLGLSRRKLLTSVILIDFLALAILMTIMFFIYG